MSERNIPKEVAEELYPGDPNKQREVTIAGETTIMQAELIVEDEAEGR